MQRSKKVLIIILVIGFVGFGYSQYASASQIGVSITQSTLVDDSDTDPRYSLQLQFDNPSLLYLTAGETEFMISADGQRIGEGTLSPFMLPALTTTIVDGTFQTSKDLEKSENVPTVKISGVTKYDMLVASIDVPFVFYPTQDQAREFIHQN